MSKTGAPVPQAVSVPGNMCKIRSTSNQLQSYQTSTNTTSGSGKSFSLDKMTQCYLVTGEFRNLPWNNLSVNKGQVQLKVYLETICDSRKSLFLWLRDMMWADPALWPIEPWRHKRRWRNRNCVVEQSSDIDCFQLNTLDKILCGRAIQRYWLFVNWDFGLDIVWSSTPVFVTLDPGKPVMPCGLRYRLLSITLEPFNIFQRKSVFSSQRWLLAIPLIYKEEWTCFVLVG